MQKPSHVLSDFPKEPTFHHLVLSFGGHGYGMTSCVLTETFFAEIPFRTSRSDLC